METLIIVISALFVFSFQLFLCLKLKSVFLKLLPATLTSCAGIYFFFMMKAATSWDALGWAVLWIVSLIVLATIVVAWDVYAIIRIVKRRK